MSLHLAEVNGQSYLIYSRESGVLNSEAKALELVAACGEAGTNRLLLEAGCLPESFFELRSGLAGQVLLKFSNYHLKVAAVADPKLVGNGRFAEFARETNRGHAFGVFPSRPEAEDWLGK